MAQNKTDVFRKNNSSQKKQESEWLGSSQEIFRCLRVTGSNSFIFVQIERFYSCLMKGILRTDLTRNIIYRFFSNVHVYNLKQEMK